VLIRHQAELGIASEPGEGSTFSVVLPARRVLREADGDEEVRDAAPTSTAAPRGTGS